MKNVKNMNDIAAIATAKVNELIANGFIFNFGTMAGSQGDEVVESHVWYRMENRNGYVYTDDAEAFEEARELHRARYANHKDGNTKSAIAPEKIVEKVRAHRDPRRSVSRLYARVRIAASEWWAAVLYNLCPLPKVQIL